MLKKYLLAATAALTMVASAAAQTMENAPADIPADTVVSFECLVTKVTPADKDKDPGYKVNISIDSQGKFSNVVHTTRSGAVFDRADQYGNLQTGLNDGFPMWFGTLKKKNPVQTISGMFVVGNPKTKEMHYVELVFGKDRKKPRTVIESICHPVEA